MRPKHFLLPFITPATFFTAMFTFAKLFLPPPDALQNIDGGLAKFLIFSSVAIVLFYGMLFILAVYILAVTPVVCLKYGRMLKRTLDSKKLRVILILYNSLLLTAFPAIIFQNIPIGTISLIWFLIWSLPFALSTSRDDPNLQQEKLPMQTEQFNT